MYQANVYKLMIGAPSDIKDEIQIASRVINRWNNLHSESKQCILLPLHWSFSSYPSSGSHPQKILNKQLVQKSDLMLCFFGSKLGTATDTEISGTVEEINEHLRSGKDVMVFFRRQIEASKVDIEQLKKLKEFKQDIQDKVLWEEYNNEHDLESALFDNLCLYGNDKFKGYELQQITIQQTEDHAVSLSEWDKERLKAWVNSGEIEGWYLDYSGWSRNYILGNVQYSVTKSEDILEWDDFFERMQEIDFITLERYDRSGTAIYKLKKAAYDYVKKYCTET